MSDEDAAAGESAPGSDDDSQVDSESDDAAAARKQNGEHTTLQLLSLVGAQSTGTRQHCSSICSLCTLAWGQEAFALQSQCMLRTQCQIV